MEESVQGQNPVQPAKRPLMSVPEDRGQDQKRGLSAFRSYGYDFKLPGQVKRDPSMMNLSWKEFLAEPPKQRKQEKLDLDEISAMWKEAAAARASKSTDHLDTPSGKHPDIPSFGPPPKLSEEAAAWKEFLEKPSSVVDL
ncbi:hypothetical protein M0R45_015661 [Rubus argutus]|uniref:Uncharacterized protein n=1 Tax=Rubus argutus TaxID=59490 RepID=A0AAW1XRI4_RUBAR